jgi:hypothetical protein
MSKKRVTWLVLAVAIVAVMSAMVAVQTEAAPRPINCKFVLCAYPDCIEGEHTEIPPGQCCPVCVPD